MRRTAVAASARWSVSARCSAASTPISARRASPYLAERATATASAYPRRLRDGPRRGPWGRSDLACRIGRRCRIAGCLGTRRARGRDGRTHCRSAGRSPHQEGRAHECQSAPRSNRSPPRPGFRRHHLGPGQGGFGFETVGRGRRGGGIRKGQGTGEHPKDQHRQRVLIAAPVNFVARELLGTHVFWRPDHEAGPGHPLGAVSGADLRGPEINHLDRIFAIPLFATDSGGSVPGGTRRVRLRAVAWDSLGVPAVAVDTVITGTGSDDRAGSVPTEARVRVRSVRSDGKVDSWRGWPDAPARVPLQGGPDGRVRLALALPLRKLRVGLQEVEVGIVDGVREVSRRVVRFVVTDDEK